MNSAFVERWLESSEVISQHYLPQVKIWSSHLLDNISNCLLNLKNSGDSTGFKPMTSAMPVQCSNQLRDMILALTRQLSSKCEDHITWLQIPHFILHFFHTTFLSRGKHEPNKLTCSQLCDFLAQLVRALHRHHKGHGFVIPLSHLNFQVHETIA